MLEGFQLLPITPLAPVVIVAVLGGFTFAALDKVVDGAGGSFIVRPLGDGLRIGFSFFFCRLSNRVLAGRVRDYHSSGSFRLSSCIAGRSGYVNVNDNVIV